MVYAAIFDMDGVLIDSHNLIWESHNRVLGRYNVKLTAEDIKKYTGKSLRDDIIDWNKKFGLHLTLEEHTRESWKIQLELLKNINVDNNLIKLLDDLKLNSIPMGVGTSSQRFRAETILELLKIQSYFPVLISANDIEKHKPYPDIFLEVARRLQIPKTSCVVFEDAGNGIEAAKRANMKSIGYLNGKNSLDELKEADLIISSFLEVSYKIIENMF